MPVEGPRILLRCLVVSDPRLSDVLARRRVLAPAEVVTLVVALALDLADLHAAGRMHGAVCAETVRFDPDGRPRLLGGGAAADPAEDVRALSALGYLALSEHRPPRLVEALEAGLAGCGAVELAERVLASGPAAPLRLPITPDRCEKTAIEPGLSTSARMHRRLVLTGIVMLLVSLVFLPRPASDSARWTDVVVHLDRARFTAVVDRNVDELSAVYDSPSPQRNRDATLIRALVRDGLTVRGRLAELTSPALLNRSGDTATMSVLEQPAAYVLVDARGRVRLSVHGVGPRRLVIRLRRTARGWRVTDATASR